MRKKLFSLLSIVGLIFSLVPTILSVPEVIAEQDCRLTLHLARFDKKGVAPPEVSRNYTGLKVYGKPFLTRFDFSKTTVGKGQNENVLYLHLTAEGMRNLHHVTATSIGFRIAALRGIGDEDRVVWVERIRTAMKKPVIGVVMEKPQEVSWLSYCLNQRIGGRRSNPQSGQKKSYEF